MRYYDRIDVSEDVNETSASKECIICHYWHFLDRRFKYQSSVCKGCHDALMISADIHGSTILNIDDVDYRCIINGTSKCVQLSKKSGSL